MSIRKRISRNPGMPEKMRRVPPYVVDAQGVMTMSDRGVRQRNARMVRVAGAEGEVRAQGWRDDLASYFQKKLGPDHRDGIALDPSSELIEWSFFESIRKRNKFFVYVLFNPKSWVSKFVSLSSTIVQYGVTCARFPKDDALFLGAYWIMEDDADGTEQADRFLATLTTPVRPIYQSWERQTPITYYQDMPPALWIVPPKGVSDLPSYAKVMLPKLEQMLARLDRRGLFGDAKIVIATTPEMASQLASLNGRLTLGHPLWLLKPEKDNEDHYKFPAGWEHIDIVQLKESTILSGVDVGTCEYVGKFQELKKEGPGRGIPYLKGGSFLTLAILGGLAYVVTKLNKKPGNLSAAAMQRRIRGF